MTTSIEKVSEAFKLCIDIAKNDGSPLNEALASQIIDDSEILEIACVAPEEQFPPDLLFGAVRYLLLGEAKGHELETFYPDLHLSHRAPHDAYPHFRQFCLAYKEAIQDIMSTHLIQTSGVGACAIMLPAFSLVAELAWKPLELIEIGAGAGLNLNWDQYHYHYDGTMAMDCGKPDAVLTLESEMRGERIPPVPEQLPRIMSRKGIDLNPLDSADEDVQRWLRALISPEHRESLNLALRSIPDHAHELIAGDALDILPEVLKSSDGGGALCVFHSTTVYQFSMTMREKLDTILMEHSHKRDIYRVSFEYEPEHDSGILRLITYQEGAIDNSLLASADLHGQWIHWQDELSG